MIIVDLRLLQILFDCMRFTMKVESTWTQMLKY